MINVKNLSIAYSGNPIFEETNFIINASEKIGLIGKNGSGKSTFFKLLELLVKLLAYSYK